MSIRAIPLLFFVFLAYNIIVLIGTGASPGDATKVLDTILFKMPMGHMWELKIGDLLVLFVFVLLFFELLKATYTSSTSLIDHGLSMVVFVVCLIEFLLVTQAQTSVFFFIVIASLIDVIAGYTIGIRVARRDFTIGGS